MAESIPSAKVSNLRRGYFSVVLFCEKNYHGDKAIRAILVTDTGRVPDFSHMPYFFVYSAAEFETQCVKKNLV